MKPSEIRAAYRRLFNTADGIIVLKHILKTAGVYSPTASGEAPHILAWQEGARSLALRIARAAWTAAELEAQTQTLIQETKYE